MERRKRPVRVIINADFIINGHPSYCAVSDAYEVAACIVGLDLNRIKGVHGNCAKSELTKLTEITSIISTSSMPKYRGRAAAKRNLSYGKLKTILRPQ